MKNQILLFILAVSFQLTAQQNTISGVVTDADNNPLPGANVLVKETSKGTQTNFDGQYSLTAYQGQTLVFSYIGFKTKEVEIGFSKTINVQLEEDVQRLEEVVTIGYSIQSERTSAASVVQIKRRKQKAYHQSISQALQGRAAGVQVGAANSIKIRGAATVKAGARTAFYCGWNPDSQVKQCGYCPVRPIEH